MNSTTIIVFIIIVSSIVTGVLYVVFGQITARKLRKNPKTKDVLGGEYVSGWDIINVAQALAFPKSWSRIMEKSPLSFMCANSELISKNTTRFDKVLGFIFYWLLISSSLFGLLLIVLDSSGFFAE